jgi:hypothetical protein
MSDEILLDLRAQILEEPENDQLRYAYADRLEQLGLTRLAAETRKQLHHLMPGIPLVGVDIGIPVAESVIFRRGFPEDITVPRNRAARIGEILCVYPVTNIWVDGRGIAIAFGILPESLDEPDPQPQWYAWVEIEGPSPQSGIRTRTLETKSWDSREQMVAEIGVWADAVLPPPPFDSSTEFALSAWEQEPSLRRTRKTRKNNLHEKGKAKSGG